jgi:circadian clock protein KaiC
MLMKLIDFFKSKGITVMIGSLTASGEAPDGTSVAISSLIDSWILLRDIEANGERTRAVFIRKSRGMSHSNKVREFVITDHGVDILEAFSGPDGVLVGDARVLGHAKQEVLALAEQQTALQNKIETNLKIKQLHTRIVDIGEELIQLEAIKFDDSRASNPPPKTVGPQ